MTKQLTTVAADILKDARQLYQAHRVATTKPIKVGNLDKIWEVLNAIHDDGGRDYSLAEVGRRLERLGGPKTQSLRNTQGAHYREIITAYANAVSGSTRYVAKNKSNVEQALDLITDPSIRATLRVALDDAKRLKIVNDNLHAAFKTLQIGASLQHMDGGGRDHQHPAPILNAELLSPRMTVALRKGIDSVRLAQQGLHICEDGSVENEYGNKILPPYFVAAIQAVLAGAKN